MRAGRRPPALLLATLTAGVYLERNWVALPGKAKAPAAAPHGCDALIERAHFFQGEGTQKIFTVEASKMTDFQRQGRELLEDVKITILERGESGKTRCIRRAANTKIGRKHRLQRRSAV